MPSASTAAPLASSSCTTSVWPHSLACRQHQLAHQHQAFVDALNVDRRALKAYGTVSINALFLS